MLIEPTPILCSRVHDLENQGLHSNPAQYYDFLQNRVMITFRPKFDEADHENPEFNLVLSKEQSYDTVCAGFTAFLPFHPSPFVAFPLLLLRAHGPDLGRGS